jgi:hypothetical protein
MGQIRNMITLRGRDGRITFKWNLKIRMWIIFVWLRIGTSFGLF